MDATEIKKIGKYEITGILGRGGMGVVYRAEDKRIGRLVAIKTLTEGYTGQPEMLERFYREAQAGILQHPNIVIVYDLGDQDGMPFIVMEHVSGEPLDKLIASGRQIPLIDRLGIIEQVCAALGYAHQRGVIHRDIKPANVIVQPDGHAKIVDFGIARVQNSAAETGLTRTGNVIGTVHYIAPERLKGQPFDGRSDIFSTGVMLYLLLAGRLPFEGEDLTVLQKLVNEPHPPLNTYISNYPPALDAILDRALAKDPEQRYSTAEEFALDLRALGDDLKKSRAGELFDEAERLTSAKEFGRAREVLLQLVKIDAQHTGAKQLLGIVQQHLSRMQRAEQVRQLVAEAEEALASARYPEALASLDQALKLDPENTEVQAKLEAVKEKKRRHDEIEKLVSDAEAARNRGDLPGAIKSLERALHLDQQSTRLRSLYTEYAKQARLLAQQEKIRGMLGSAKQELSSRHFTAAVNILQEIGKLDPSLPELEPLLQTAMSGQEQERRRKLLEQVQAQIESCLLADDYDRATDLVSRAVEQLPTEASLLQLKTRVATQARQFRVKQLVDTTAAQAQEAFSRSPNEALQLVQNALREVPGEQRLLALENSFRQRLKALEIEEVRGRYLREAQEAIDKGKFESAISTLESYRIEFADAEGVNELLEFARGELAKQQRRNRVASITEQARAFIQQERLDDAIRLLEPACAETKDAALSQLLSEAREQQAESARRLELLTSRVKTLRERGKLDQAIDLLKDHSAAAAEGAPLFALLTDLRAEHARGQAISNAVAAANSAIEKGDFHAGLEALQGVRRAYGESDQLTKAIADFEAKRAAAANQVVTKSVEAARAALLNSDPVAAMNELRSSAELVDFAGASQQADWRRLKAEAAKPVRKSTGSVAAGESFEIAAVPEERRRKWITPVIAVGFVLAVAVNAGLWWYSHHSKSQQPAPVQTATTAPPPIAAAPTGTLLVKGNTDNAQVFVDGLIKGFTQSDGTLAIPLDPGNHSVRFVKPGYQDSSTSTITISANKQTALPFDLAQSKSAAAAPKETEAYLTIHSTPGAAVLVNGQPLGKADSRGNLIVPVKPGKVALQISMGGYHPVSQSMTVKAGDHPSVVAMLNPIAAPARPAAAPAPQPVQILSFAATASQIESGQSTTLKWQTANASEVSIDNGIARVDNSGQTTVRPAQTTTYTLTAKGPSGTQQRTVNIIVEAKVIAAAPRPAAAAPAPTPTVDEPALIRQVLNSFQAAYNAHDMGRMRGVWTGMSKSQAKGLENFFKSYPGSKVQDACSVSALSVSGDSAQWACKETTTLKVSGREISSAHDIRFSFVKKNGAWSISERN
ncbi:MAG TPA: protein kinase [Acidobacteriaceae bacterium]|nr:protein kinase [Acidobacteriaceae bacterium]